MNESFVFSYLAKAGHRRTALLQGSADFELHNLLGLCFVSATCTCQAELLNLMQACDRSHGYTTTILFWLDTLPWSASLVVELS